MIIKARPESDYVVIPNDLAQHRGLSFAARGMLLYLLSKPADWVIQEVDLINEADMGRDAVRRVVRELVEVGYLRRIEKRMAGKFSGVEYVAYPSVAPSPEKPSTAKPSPANPTHTKERDIQKKDSYKNNIEIDKSENGMSAMKHDLDEDDFAMWWAAYPRQVSRKKARDAYMAASRKVDRATLLRAAEGYAKEVKGRDKEYITMPVKFLREEMWEDYDNSKRRPYMLDGEEKMLTTEEAEYLGAYKKGED